MPGEYDDVPRPLAAAGGGFVVPNATLYVVPAAPADQPRTDAVETPVALLAGAGDDGAGGGPVVPAVVNDQVFEVAIMFGASGVALVRETTFQKYVVPD